MVTRAKIPKVEPIGDILSPQSAFIQASNILDLATHFAIETKSIEGLTHIASVYADIGTMLIQTAGGMDEEDPDFDDSGKQPLGFRPTIVPVEVEEGIVKDE